MSLGGAVPAGRRGALRQQALKGPQNSISTRSLARGVYAVTIGSATQVVTRKLIVE